MNNTEQAKIVKQPRPTVTQNMILAAVLPVAESLGMSAETIVNHYRYPMDGFDLALELSKYAGMDVSRNDFEELDGIEWSIRIAHEAAQKIWVTEFDIQPPLPIGSKITKGVVEGICGHKPACYLVKEYGCTDDSRYLIIKFEKAELLKEPS